MACSFIGFDKTQISDKDIGSVFNCLPNQFQNEIKSIVYKEHDDFNKQFKFLNFTPAMHWGLISGNSSKKVWYIVGPNSDSLSAIQYMARFVPNMVKQASLFMGRRISMEMDGKFLEKNNFIKKNRNNLSEIMADLLYSALMINISEPSESEWRKLIALRLFAQTHSHDWVNWAMKDGLGFFYDKVDYSQLAHKIRLIQKRMIKTASSRDVKRAIKLKFEKPYQRSVWLNDIFKKSTHNDKERIKSMAVPDDLVLSLRSLVNEGEPININSYSHLINTLRVL